jgi:PHD/YefM family antitoxin component YafN of YafNO toxin-antitoxin module
MIKYAENELFSISTFTKQISKLLNSLKSRGIEKIGILRNNRLEAVVLSTEEYARLKKIEEESKSKEWTYWSAKVAKAKRL